MRNTFNEQTKKFIQKLQPILADLYREYISIDDPGIRYNCPLNELMENCDWVASLSVEDTINEDF